MHVPRWSCSYRPLAPLFFHLLSFHEYGSPLTRKRGAGNTTSESLLGPLVSPAFPSAVPEELPATCRCAKCKYSNDSFQKKKAEKRKRNRAGAEVCTVKAQKPKDQADQRKKVLPPPPTIPIMGSSILTGPPKVLQSISLHSSCPENLTLPCISSQVNRDIHY